MSEIFNADPRPGTATNKQKQLIWRLARNAHIEEEDLRDMTETISGQRSTKELSRAQAAQLIDRLLELSGKVPKARRERPGKITEKQIWMVGQIETGLGWSQTPWRLHGLVKKLYKADALEWLTHAQGWRLIETLKEMLKKYPGGRNTAIYNGD